MAMDQQRGVMFEEFQHQVSEALLHQKTSLVSEIRAEGNRMGSDNSLLRARLEQMHKNMSEIRQEMFIVRSQVAAPVEGNLSGSLDFLTPSRIPLPPSPTPGRPSEALALGLP